MICLSRSCPCWTRSSISEPGLAPLPQGPPWPPLPFCDGILNVLSCGLLRSNWCCRPTVKPMSIKEIKVLETMKEGKSLYTALDHGTKSTRQEKSMNLKSKSTFHGNICLG